LSGWQLSGLVLLSIYAMVTIPYKQRSSSGGVVKAFGMKAPGTQRRHG
jgi:hypothetical protein